MTTFAKTARIAAATLLVGAAFAVTLPAPADAQERGLFGLFPGKGFEISEQAQRERDRQFRERGLNRRVENPGFGNLSYGGRQPLIVRNKNNDGSTLVFF